MKRVLVTGISGQDGAYLAASLISEGYHVVGLARTASEASTWRLKYLGILDLIDIRRIDITDQGKITDLIRSEGFEEIYNLSAQSSVGASWNAPVCTTLTNCLGALHIMEAIRKYSSKTKLFQASSSEMYGHPRIEKTGSKGPFYPTSPYATSKVFAHQMVENYRTTYGLFFCSGILYNHESPLRSVDFVSRKITSTLVSIKLGSTKALKLGNIMVERDWGYAPEYVEGMKRILRNSDPDDFELATGRADSIKDFANFAATAVGFELEWSGKEHKQTARDRYSGRLIIQVDPGLYRPAELKSQIGSPSKAREILGWSATTKLNELAEIMIKADYDRLN